MASDHADAACRSRLIGAVEGGEQLRQGATRRARAVVGRTVCERTAALYATPVWVHNSGVRASHRREHGLTWGFGARFGIWRPRIVVAEVTPRLGGYVVGDPEYGVRDREARRRAVFSLTFANSRATTYR